LATIKIVNTKRQHIEPIAKMMRSADRYEVWASSLATPYQAIASSLEYSDLAWTAMVDDEPIFIFGVAAISPISRHGAPWMLGSQRIEDFPVTFLRSSRKCLTLITDQYPILSNFVDARNITSINWLEWLGFTIKPAQPFGPFNLLFHPFELRR
jgi:hypothetical protein